MINSREFFGSVYDCFALSLQAPRALKEDFIGVCLDVLPQHLYSGIVEMSFDEKTYRYQCRTNILYMPHPSGETEILSAELSAILNKFLHMKAFW